MNFYNFEYPRIVINSLNGLMSMMILIIFCIIWSMKREGFLLWKQKILGLMLVGMALRPLELTYGDASFGFFSVWPLWLNVLDTLLCLAVVFSILVILNHAQQERDESRKSLLTRKSTNSLPGNDDVMKERSLTLQFFTLI